MKKLTVFLFILLAAFTLKAQINVLSIDAAAGKTQINKNI